MHGSLVGQPMDTAKDDHTTMENRAAHNATRAMEVSSPKLTMLVMVEATVALIMVMTTIPAQLHTAAMTIATLTSRDLVDTQVAMALGASVIPFTQMTPKVSSTVINKAGFVTSCRRKKENDISIILFYLLSYSFTLSLRKFYILTNLILARF